MNARRFLAATGLGLGLALGLLALLGRPTGAAHADSAVRYVSSAGVDSGDCTVSPCETIQYAVDVAGTGDIIQVRYGVYDDIHNIGGYDQVVYLSKTLTIRGGYSDGFTAWDPAEFPATLNANGSARVVYIDGDVAPTLEGLWLTGGTTTASGGGIASNHASPVISDCRIYGNEAGYGGGAWIFDGEALLTNNALYDNVADDGGGGVSLHFSSGTLLTGNTLYNNEAYAGGGVYIYESDGVTLAGNAIYSNTVLNHGGGIYLTSDITPSVTGNVIYSNSAGSYGGGIYVGEVNTATLTGNTITSNDATTGGGAYVLGRLGGRYGTLRDRKGALDFTMTYPVLVGNTFVGNTANSGGGIYLYGELPSWITLTNNIVADNQASISGPGVYVKGLSALLRHTTIARNTGADGSGVYITSGEAVLTNTILVSHTVGIYVSSDSTGTLEATLWGGGAWANASDWGGTGTIVTGTKNLRLDPLFANPDLGNYHLRSGSPAVDEAIDVGIATDSDGDPRYGAAPDIGADESTCLARTGGTDYPTIQQAVDAAGATVLVAEGVCYESVTANKTVTIEGGWNTAFTSRYPDPALHTTVDAARAGRGFTFIRPGTDIAPELDGFTVTGGDASDLGGGAGGYDMGGGIYGNLADVTVSNCIVRDNIASTTTGGMGGGVGFYNGDTTLQGNIIEENIAVEGGPGNAYGGGIALRGGTHSVLSNTIQNNRGHSVFFGRGGGVSVRFAAATFQDNVVQGNMATDAASQGFGAGIWSYLATVDLHGDRITENTTSAPGGTGEGGGLGAYYNSAITMDDVEIGENEATFGGGAYFSESAEARLANSDIYSNTAGMGGGLYFSFSPTATLTGNFIHGNEAGYAGGIQLTGSGATMMEGNEVYANTSDGLAGAIWIYDSSDTTLNGNRIYGNVADSDGAGLHLLISYDVLLTNNLIVDNHIAGSGKGVGVHFDGSDALFLHTTVARNTGGDGSGFYVGNNSIASLTNTILVSQTVGITVTTGSTVTYEATLWGAGAWDNGTDQGGSGSATGIGPDYWLEPVFVDGANGDYHLGPGSPAIDAGVDVSVPDDMDGDGRPIGPDPDLGADEAPVWIYLPAVFQSYH